MLSALIQTRRGYPAVHLAATITSFFDWNKLGSKSTTSSLITDSHLSYDEDGSLTYKDRYNTPTLSELNPSATPFTPTNLERFYYKPDHVLVVKNGDLPDFYPDENHDYTAVSFVQSDPLNTGLIRTIVIKDDSKFKIIQKRNSDAIFSGDNRPYGEDFVSIEIPVEYIDDKVRDRIRKYNLDTKRDKVIELTYDDFVAFSDFIVEHPEVQQRLKFSDLHQRVRTNKYDADIITNFEGKKTFIDEKVYSVINNNIRNKERKPGVGRVNKDQTQISESYSTVSPIHASLSPAATSTAYRSVQQNNTPFATTRSGKVQLSKFNS